MSQNVNEALFTASRGFAHEAVNRAVREPVYRAVISAVHLT